MSIKLYVGGLSEATTSDTLRTHFAPFGTVESAAVVTDRDSERSRGFGFVEMSSQAEADEAIAKLNEHEIDGKAVTVNIAKARAPRT